MGVDGFLSGPQIEQLLARLGEMAEAEGLHIRMFLVGGGAMALAYNTGRLTGDIGAVFEPKQRVYELARRLAAESDLDLGDGWLNDAVKAFLPGEDPDAVGVLADAPGISVTVASPRYLFALKAMSARESDEDDLRTLYPLCGFRSADEALDLIEAAYPRRPTPNVEYTVRAIAEQYRDTNTGVPTRSGWFGRLVERVRRQPEPAPAPRPRPLPQKPIGPPNAGTSGPVWVPPHIRNGKRVAGHFRRRGR